MDQRALYIDDNEINRKVLDAMLASQGVGMDEAVDGPTGIDKYHSLPFDWLLIDYRMPNMDGLEVIERIRAEGGRGSSVPICLITAEMDPQLEEMARRSGANRVIHKPITLDDLCAFLAEHWPGSAQAGRA